MKLKSKEEVTLKDPVPVYDISVSSYLSNFCLGNGVVVHNSKDISDAVVGVIYNLYQHIDQAGMMSSRYKAEVHQKFFESKTIEVDDTFQQMVQNLY